MSQGLRERKRIAAMVRIQSAALDLFERRGFDAVTVEEIAESSEVSPSSVYRYFGTKERLVLWDEFDPPLREHLAVAVASGVPLEGLRRELMGVLAGFTPQEERQVIRRVSLALSHPALEQATVAQAHDVAKMLENVLSRQLGRAVEDLEVQVFAHAFTGGLLGMFHHWQGTGFREPILDVVGRVFEIFEEGLDIVTASSAGNRSGRPPSTSGDAPSPV